ncbi:acyl-CoA dehydrogenase [Sphingomonas nostoxanthinifaciens]|uniref:acyl-CoA dehydrogenase n=1 Tax=Sphingomonas nostoxanthinifaciens TaxID=2872652 RepID=UPI001CC1C78C|nr:acyl-CoA dehydrogenase [Sphingomonas nostoxanthinifaciens]UAK23230.1 acyl-CoA dehydrogenase [Sphingomonas nostoxanthinifaciens]
MNPPLERADIAALTARLDDLADPKDAAALLELLRLLHWVGRRDLPLGRVFEGHVDALQIIARYGTPGQARDAQDAARRGAAFGVWNADQPGDPLLLCDGRLDGAKAFASGAGVLSHAIVSVDVEGQRQLILIDLDRVAPIIDRTWWRVTGMQRSETHIVRWTDQTVDADALIGVPGDYVREPWFGGGAIRFAAVQAGGIAAIVDQVRDHLVAQDRVADPHQSARLAQLYLAAQSAADAVAAAARSWRADDIVGTLARVAAARVAVYEAGERALTIAQAAVGVQAMFVDHPLAATLADLAVYLRQPGPDAQRARVGGAVAANILTPTL